MTSLLDIKLIHGDCLEEMKKIKDDSVDLILTDLPYQVTKCKWDVLIPFEPMWSEIRRISKDRTPTLLFGAEPFSSQLRLSNLKDYKYDWYWHKSKSGNFMNANRQPHKRIELCSVFYEKQCLYIPQKIQNPKGIEKRMLKENTSKQKEFGVDGVASRELITQASPKYEADKLLPTCLIEFSNVSKPVHPTQKPVELLEYLIKTYTNEGDVVLDFTMGSGSTGVAAVNLNRKFIGIEKNEKYFKIAQERILGGEEV